MKLRRSFAALACLLAATSSFAQSISGLNPRLGSVGETVVIQGSGFAPGGQKPATLLVQFNGTTATTNPNAVTADNQIHVQVPAGTTTGPVTVRINGGSPASSPYDFLLIGAGPYVTNFTPVVGSFGTVVTLTGVHFSSVTNVSFNGRLGTAFNNAALNQIQITAPSGVTTGPLIALSSLGVSFRFSTLTNQLSSSTNFFVQPIITGFSPGSGRTGTNVLITGTNFTAARAVLFGSVNAPSYTVLSNNAILAVAPTNVITGRIEVRPAVSEAANGLSITNFRVLPTLTGFLPATGAPLSTVVITGMNLNERTPQPLVTFNGVNATVSGSSFGSITSTVPAGAASGFITVTTTNGAVTSDLPFYLPASISSFSPTNSAPGTRVTILGANFTNATAVSFNGTPVPPGTFTVTNNTSIGVTVPAGVITGPIGVTTPAGTASTAALFYGAPQIDSFLPGMGDAGTRVTVNGTNFLGATAVRFNGVNASSFTVTNNGRLGATVPPGAQTGPISVVAPAGTNTSAELFYLPPTITSFIPTNSAPGSRITITGLNLTDASSVSFNGIPVPEGTFSVSNNTTIGVTVPVGVTTGPISVTTPGGSDSSSTLFYALPEVASFTPTHGLPGDRVTVTGANFLGATAVTFNGLPASSFTVTNNNLLGVTVPVGAQTGPIAVTAPAGTGISVMDFVLDYASDISVTVVDTPDPVFIGSNLVYSVQASNSGPHEATSLKLTNTLPTSVILIGASVSQGTLTTNGNRIIANIGSVPSGSVRTLTLTVLPQAVGTITNNAAAASSNLDGVPANNSLNELTTVWPLPVLSIQRLTSEVQLSWPAVLSNFSVQITPALGAGNWVNLTNLPVITNDLSIITQTNLGDTNAFFRLRN